MKNEPISAKMTITLVVGGKTIELSETDARKLLAELKRVFPDPVESWTKSRPAIPQWPTLPVHRPYTHKPDDHPFRKFEITCSSSRLLEKGI